MQKHGGMLHLESRGLRLFVRTEGQGDPVVFMHGGPGADHSTMLPFLPLSSEHRLVFYDHRCNGRSLGADVGTMTWENLAADAEALRVALGIDRWAVVGHSFGGMVALEYALRYPQSLTRLCVLDSAASGREIAGTAERSLAQRGYGRLAVSTAQRFFTGRIGRRELSACMMILGRAYYSKPTLGLMAREAWHGLFIRKSAAAFIHGFSRLIPDWTVTERLHELDVPTLILAGADDFQFPPGQQALMAQRMKRARLEIVEGAGHNAPSERRDQVLQIVGQFLRPGAPGARMSTRSEETSQ